MKQLILLPLLMSLSLQANASSLKEKLMDYGLPCLVSFLGGSVLADGSKNQMAIGVTGCLAIGTSTYLQQKKDSKTINEADMARINEMLDKSSAEKAAENQRITEERLATIESAQKTQLEEMRAIVREVLAERLVKLEEGVKSEVSKKLESGEFMPALEKNLSEAMKKEVLVRVSESQRGIVEKCVERTIQEVTAQPIGTRQNQDNFEN